MVKKQLNLPAAIRSFLGYLEGTEKAAHTIKSYRLDLESFQNFLVKKKGLKQAQKLESLTQKDLDHYHASLKSEGLKTNTRRRKLMTLRKFLSYLAGRKKISVDLGKTLVTPQKIERVPMTLSQSQLLVAVRALPLDTEILARNRVLLWTMIETGCLVSEVTRLKYEDYNPAAKTVGFYSREPRTVPISDDLISAVHDLRRKARNPDNPWLFLGFNKFGPMGGAESGPMTSRGVELLVRSLAPRLGSDEVTPRILRHSTVKEWLDSGLSRDEIQKRLGLKTAYAFRTFEPILAKKREQKEQTADV